VRLFKLCPPTVRFASIADILLYRRELALGHEETLSR
jgi:hypothetical protein